MFTWPLEMSEMLRQMLKFISFFTEERMAKTTVANFGYKMTKRTTSREGGPTSSLWRQQKCWVPYIIWQLVMITVGLAQGGIVRRYMNSVYTSCLVFKPECYHNHSPLSQRRSFSPNKERDRSVFIFMYMYIVRWLIDEQCWQSIKFSCPWKVNVQENAKYIWQCWKLQSVIGQ